MLVAYNPDAGSAGHMVLCARRTFLHVRCSTGQVRSPFYKEQR